MGHFLTLGFKQTMFCKLSKKILLFSLASGFNSSLLKTLLLIFYVVVAVGQEENK